MSHPQHGWELHFSLVSDVIIIEEGDKQHMYLIQTLHLTIKNCTNAGPVSGDDGGNAT